MNTLGWAVTVYGLLVWAGGVWGYVQVGSRWSLVTGTILGVAAVAGGFYIRQSLPLGLILSLATSALAAVILCIRYAISRRLTPSGLLAVLSLGMAGWLAIVLAR